MLLPCLLVQKVEETRNTRRQLGVAVVHRVDGPVLRHGVAHQHLHQVTALAVVQCHEVGQADDACTGQRQSA